MKNLSLVLISFREIFQVMVVLLLPVISPIHAQRHWDEVGVMPEGAILLNAETVGDNIYVMGGLLSISLPTDAVYAFNPADTSFTPRQPIPEVIGASATAVLDGKIYLFGGVKSSLGQTTPHCYVYDPAINQWSTLPDMSNSRGYAVAEAVDSKIYVIGGIGPWGAPLLNVVEVYDPANNTWSIRTPMPTSRGYMSSEVLNNKIYVIGGLRWPENISLNEVEIYDPATDMWSVGDDLPTPRLGLAAGLLDGTIYTVSGFDTNPYYDVPTVEGFSEGSGWLTYDSLPYPVHGLAVAVYGGSLYAFGGLNLSNSFTEDEVYVFHSESVGLSDDFEKVPLLGQPFPNPFREKTSITVMLPKSVWVALGVYDIQGRLVESLENNYLPAGNYVYHINIHDQPGGTYFCQIRMNGVYINSRKIIFVP